MDAAFGSGLYSADEQSELPAEAVLASLGCGNPLAVAELHAGERVLDLGSGGGIDVLLSARRVGETGFAYGVDMTDEMLALARANAAKAGATNVEFLKGTIENVPLPDGAVDVVISNCVINLSVDKPAVLAEMFRVLAPGGRVGVSDVVAEDHLTSADRAERGTYVGCIAGALSRQEYLDGLAAAGFVDAEVTLHPRGGAGHAFGDRARGQASRRCGQASRRCRRDSVVNVLGDCGGSTAASTGRCVSATRAPRSRTATPATASPRRGTTRLSRGLGARPL